MPTYDRDALLDYETSPGEVWIRTTPGRLRAFLARYVEDDQNLPPQSQGAADQFLQLLRDAEKAL